MAREAKKYLYFDIPKQERDSAIAFLLDALLKSKLACRDDSPTEESMDEDVNIYLAHLLFAASLPDYQKAIKRYLSSNVSEMTELVEENDDRIVRYFIYKVNADHLLVHLGIFRDLESVKSGYSKSERQYSSMGESYYKQASEFNQRIYRRQTAIGSVLDKLSRGFDRYQRILRFARKEFFHFSNQFRDDEFLKFCDKFKTYETEKRLHVARDRFLDLYMEWKKSNNTQIRTTLLEAAKELESLDPEFKFHLE